MWQRRKLQLLSFQKKPVALVFPSHCRKGAVCTGDSRWVLGAELLSMPRSHPAALKSFSFRGSLPSSKKTLALLFSQHAGPASRKNTFPANFSSGLSISSADTHNTYKEQEVEEKEEVLGDFQAAGPHLLSLTGSKGKAERHPAISVKSPRQSE